VKEKILLVDDEVMLLDSLRRELGFRYSIDTAQSGAEGLDKIWKEGPYAVVVSDFRMPVMDGIKFLAQVKETTPDSVRMMLTGNTDLPTAIDAINQGEIFRFLTKPCTGDQLTQALDAGLRQYQLVMAEKELLEKTLKESITMLTEVLDIVNNQAYGRSLRIQQLVAHIVREMKIKDGWQYEMAAALSQLGWIIFPPAMLEKINAGHKLDAQEELIFSKHPFLASKLLEKIPRLENVSKIIAGQNRSIDDLCMNPAETEKYTIDLGSHILKVCVDYDRLMLQGLLHDQILTSMQAMPGVYSSEVIRALQSLQSAQSSPEFRSVDMVNLDGLEAGMMLVEPIKDKNGTVIVKANSQITRTTIVELVKIDSGTNSLVQPFKVLGKKDW
jgi:response regulator RpfG family c-di-GMP phosphodiesterase